MTTFTSEDINNLKTDWFPGDVEPVNEGEYEVMSSAWPWPHCVLWTKKDGWETADHNKWRGLREQIE